MVTQWQFWNYHSGFWLVSSPFKPCNHLLLLCFLWKRTPKASFFFVCAAPMSLQGLLTTPATLQIHRCILFLSWGSSWSQPLRWGSRNCPKEALWTMKFPALGHPLFLVLVASCADVLYARCGSLRPCLSFFFTPYLIWMIPNMQMFLSHYRSKQKARFIQGSLPTGRSIVSLINDGKPIPWADQTTDTV